MKEGDAISILPDYEIVAAIVADSQKSKFQWTHNGVFVTEIEHFQVENNVIRMSFFLGHLF